jgi:hypothetical protein
MTRDPACISLKQRRSEPSDFNPVHGAVSVSPGTRAAAKETTMAKNILTLLLLSLALTGCIVEPGGYRDGGHGEFHSDRGDDGGWRR